MEFTAYKSTSVFAHFSCHTPHVIECLNKTQHVTSKFVHMPMWSSRSVMGVIMKMSIIRRNKDKLA